MQINKLIRAAAYPRYSSDNQREESITAQMRAIEAYCQQKGYVIVDIYPDEELTGTVDRRPEFQRMIDDSYKRLFDVVVVHKLDRFARNRYDSAHYKRILKKNGIKVESVLEQLDGSPESVILESVLEGMAEYYSLNLAREVMKGMFVNAELGIHTGGRPAYGLRVNPETRKYEIDERTYRAVQIYFDGIDNDVPNPAIAARLNEEGFRTQTGEEFTANSFYGWATNRKYKGDYVYNASSAKDEEGKRNTNKKKPESEQTIIPGIIPAIISAEQWDRVNEKFKSRKRTPGRMKAKVVYLLSGKVYCGNCGALYSGNSYKNSKSSENTLLTYYKCQAKCGNTSVRKEDLEQLVMEKLVYNCFTNEGMLDIAKRVQELYLREKKQSMSDVEPIKRELSELNVQIKNWTTAIGAGVMSVIDNIKQAEQRKEALLFALQRAELMDKAKTVDEELVYKVLENKKNSLNSSDENDKKEVLQEYVDRIVIQSSTDINHYDAEITYRVFNGGGEGI
ncbi:recombinase family protein [Paenibacillus oenotherae]|uniref:Recombinase family protein n=1 Tax=Paenibacillus oenotherae TaxID=1435645 RepID=A0ABS7D7J8_9BACL|nr:recombinase family protein [Paenibacillus oenotherae]MBW7475912.1 recombinase family protein [Paenibacillus oenotherae]